MKVDLPKLYNKIRCNSNCYNSFYNLHSLLLLMLLQFEQLHFLVPSDHETGGKK